MSFTREEVIKMNEANLRTRVLIPLFRAMGFRDVQHYHGGSLEQGKDIVMWKSGDLGERVNYGVVVKVGKINGQANGRSSAAEVRFQIEQCFGSPYPDIVTTEERSVHRCFVVSSGDITKEAMYAINGALRNASLDKITKFIDGNKLSQLIEEFMPEQNGFEHLRIARDKLNAKSEYVNVIADTEGTILFEPKSPDIMRHHMDAFTGSFRFDPTTEQGRRAHTDLERHIATGVSIKLQRSQFAELILPEFLRPFIESDEEMEMHFHSLRGELEMPLRITVTNNSGGQASLEQVWLESIQVGDNEVTFDNARQGLPWTLTIKLNNTSRRAEFSYRLELEGANVKPVRDLVRFTEVLADGAEITLENINTGVKVTYHVAPGICKRTPGGTLRLLDSLVAIQGKTGVMFTVPSGSIHADEVRNIHHVARICETGRTTFEAQPVSAQSTPEQAQQALTSFGGGQITNLYFNGISGSLSVLDIDVPTGPFGVYCDQVQMTPADEATLRAALSAAVPGDFIEVRLTPCPGQKFEGYYFDWYPAERDAEGRLSLPVRQP